MGGGGGEEDGGMGGGQPAGRQAVSLEHEQRDCEVRTSTVGGRIGGGGICIRRAPENEAICLVRVS